MPLYYPTCPFYYDGILLSGAKLEYPNQLKSNNNHLSNTNQNKKQDDKDTNN